jgi:hypothetical protein
LYGGLVSDVPALVGLIFVELVSIRLAPAGLILTGAGLDVPQPESITTTAKFII